MECAATILVTLGMSLSVALLPGTAGVRPASQVPAAHDDRVRSSSARVRALIVDAAERSATFRDLVRRIVASDGIVMVEEGACPGGARACLAWRVTLAERYRILFVFVQPARPDPEMMASIGHELRHALEVLDQPSLRSDWAIMNFYMPARHPHSLRVTAETRAAETAGDAVLREVRRSLRHEGP